MRAIYFKGSSEQYNEITTNVSSLSLFLYLSLYFCACDTFLRCRPSLWRHSFRPLLLHVYIASRADAGEFRKQRSYYFTEARFFRYTLQFHLDLLSVPPNNQTHHGARQEGTHTLDLEVLVFDNDNFIFPSVSAPLTAVSLVVK
jgi:hypothetical protein